MRARLVEQGIGTGVHYVPVHHHPYYRDVRGAGPGDLLNAERIGERTFSLPLNAQLTDEDVERVIAGVQRVFSG